MAEGWGYHRFLRSVSLEELIGAINFAAIRAHLIVITIRRFAVITFEILSFLLPRLSEILRLHSIRFSHESIGDRALSLEYAPAPFRFLELDSGSWLTLFAGIVLTRLVTVLL
jgi:hypothetical protein